MSDEDPPANAVPDVRYLDDRQSNEEVLSDFKRLRERGDAHPDTAKIEPQLKEPPR